MFANKTIIGIVGGIGSGKSFVADLFGELGALVIHSDDLVHQAYRDPDLKHQLYTWWGPSVLTAQGEINRVAVASKIFHADQERKRLESVVHPLVAKMRDELMAQAADNSQVLAYAWDTPLLLETGLQRDCDAIVFVDAPDQTRLSRLQSTRNWTSTDLTDREKFQLPLDRKRQMSDYVVSNTSDAAFARGQVRQVFSQIVQRSSQIRLPGDPSR